MADFAARTRDGLIIGIGFALLQQRFGFIKMPGNFLVSAAVILQAETFF